MSLQATYNAAITARRAGQSIQSALQELKARDDLRRLRGERVSPTETAICASLLSLPLTSAELEPDDAALDLLEQLTQKGQTITSDLRNELKSLNLQLNERTSLTDHDLILLLRLSRWRSGAINLPGQLKSGQQLNPLREAERLLNARQPSKNSFATLITRRSRFNQLTQQQKDDIFHGRLHLTEPRHVEFWNQTLREWMNDRALRRNLAASNMPHSPLAAMLLAEPLRTAYASGPLAGTPEQPVNSQPPEVHAELAELMEFHGGTQLALSLIMGPPAVIPEDTGEQLRLLNWLHLCQRLLGVNGNHALHHTQLPSPSDAGRTPSAENILLSDAALVHWVRLSDPGMKTDQPATKTLHHLLYKSPDKDSVTEAWLRRSVRLSEAWLALLLSGDAAPKDHFYTQSLSDYIIRGIATAIRDIPDHTRLLATFIVQRNELGTYMLRHANKTPAMTRLTDPELHLPWVPMSPQTREERISELARLLAEDRQ